jgi:hypothetical protein
MLWYLQQLREGKGIGESTQAQSVAGPPRSTSTTAQRVSQVANAVMLAPKKDKAAGFQEQLNLVRNEFQPTYPVPGSS